MLFLQALKLYKKLNGHVDIPKSFTIPENITYPEELWGMKLGLKTSNFIYRGDFEGHRDKIEEIGLSSGKMGFDKRHWEFIFTALQTYKQINGHVKVRIVSVVSAVFECSTAPFPPVFFYYHSCRF